MLEYVDCFGDGEGGAHFAEHVVLGQAEGPVDVEDDAFELRGGLGVGGGCGERVEMAGFGGLRWARRRCHDWLSGGTGRA